MENLIHLIYASAAARPLAPQELSNILTASRENNSRVGITGMLLHSEGSFFQVLEGDEATVDALFTRIDEDSRHVKTTCIIREPIAVRSFDAWSMGYMEMSESEASEIVGANDFFQQRSCLQSLNAGRARKLLQAFASGRWHMQLRAEVPGGVTSANRVAVT